MITTVLGTDLFLKSQRYLEELIKYRYPAAQVLDIVPCTFSNMVALMPKVDGIYYFGEVSSMGVNSGTVGACYLDGQIQNPVNASNGMYVSMARPVLFDSCQYNVSFMGWKVFLGGSAISPVLPTPTPPSVGGLQDIFIGAALYLDEGHPLNQSGTKWVGLFSFGNPYMNKVGVYIDGVLAGTKSTVSRSAINASDNPNIDAPASHTIGIQAVDAGNGDAAVGDIHEFDDYVNAGWCLPFEVNNDLVWFKLGPTVAEWHTQVNTRFRCQGFNASNATVNSEFTVFGSRYPNWVNGMQTSTITYMRVYIAFEYDGTWYELPDPVYVKITH